MNILNVTERSMVPAEHFHEEEIAPGVTFRRLYPGGMAGPNRECYNDKPGGQTWSESFMFGEPDDDVIMCVPDIRLPPQQFFPLHWHDCWTVVAVIEGKCLIGDWYMETGDVFISAPSVEYGPLVPGPMGARVLEIFADLKLSPGGYVIIDDYYMEVEGYLGRMENNPGLESSEVDEIRSRLRRIRHAAVQQLASEKLVPDSSFQILQQLLEQCERLLASQGK